ncbi:MAG: acyl--CoA ligase [Lachnospiraceae bacterium]|nr:acyl--CoA ligase [Lachnospiraceae bacterium]
MGSITELFFKQAERKPDKQAIWCDGKEMTYSELASFVCRYSNYLRKKGVNRGDIIGIPMNNSIESVALMLASASIGAGLAPINPTLPVDAIDAAFEAGQVKHVIARSSFFKKHTEKLSCREGLRLCLDGNVEGMDSLNDVYKMPADKPDMSAVTGDETWILTMTSGSTGVPKPIELTQNNKLHRIEAHVKLYGITENDRVLAATPLYHSLAERLVLIPLVTGAASILLPRFTPNIWLKCASENKATFTIAVSAQLGQVAQLLSSPFVPDITGFRSIVSSSALLEPHVRTELIQKLSCDFHEMYGTSETSTVTSINFREAESKQQSVGRSIPEADIIIINDDENVVSTGEKGEIAVKSTLMFNGYYKNKDMTQKAFSKDGYFKTGDLGRLDEDGYLYYCGRKKELIITGGINVYPYDVESSISKVGGVKECAAFSYPDDRLGEVVAVALVKDKDTDITERDIKIHCARNLADFQQPHYVFFVNELPKNPMGKLVRNRIFELVRTQEV